MSKKSIRVMFEVCSKSIEEAVVSTYLQKDHRCMSLTKDYFNKCVELSDEHYTSSLNDEDLLRIYHILDCDAEEYWCYLNNDPYIEPEYPTIEALRAKYNK